MPATNKSRPGCLICKARKVRCDQALGPCPQCNRLGLSCPGLSDEKMTHQDLHAIVENAFQHAGRRRRVQGACHECQIAKMRCSRGRPSCQRCTSKSLSCTYSSERGKRRRADQDGTGELPVQESQRVSDDQQRVLPSSLPDDPAHLRVLVESYFVHVHPLRCLSFIHKPSFIQSLDRGEAEQEFGQALMCIICAFGARHLDSSSQAENERLSLSWATKAQEIAFLKLGHPSISNLMALVLLCEWHMQFDQESTAFIIAGTCSRLAQLLRLDSEATDESLMGIPKTLLTAEREARRRLLWSCYILDVHISSGVDLISNWPSLPQTRLPCSIRDFILQTEPETGTLREGSDYIDALTQSTNMCLEAYIVHVVYFRKQVLRLIRRSDPGVLSDFAQLITQLEKCGESFPRHLHLNEINAYVNEENNQLSSFYSLHLLYNQCFCDLYRVTLPGYRFPLSAILTEQRPDSVRALQGQCAYYAQRITAILQNALSRGTKGFGDPICAICAYESSKIQIVYARTCAKEDKTTVTQNLGINLTALDIITGWDKKRVVLVSSLAKLLQDFGFSDLANEWLTRNKMRSHSSDDAPPETHHLHPLALYRMTWKEISWPQRTDTSIASTLSRPSYWPDAGNGDDRVQQNSPHTSAPMEELPFDLEGMPSVNDQLLPDADSYLQMADDFSNYLTWDPWNFGYS